MVVCANPNHPQTPTFKQVQGYILTRAKQCCPEMRADQVSRFLDNKLPRFTVLW